MMKYVLKKGARKMSQCVLVQLVKDRKAQPSISIVLLSFPQAASMTKAAKGEKSQANIS